MADEAAQLELKKRRTFRYYTHTIVIQDKKCPYDTSEITCNYL